MWEVVACVGCASATAAGSAVRVHAHVTRLRIKSAGWTLWVLKLRAQNMNGISRYLGNVSVKVPATTTMRTKQCLANETALAFNL